MDNTRSPLFDIMKSEGNYIFARGKTYILRFYEADDEKALKRRRDI